MNQPTSRVKVTPARYVLIVDDEHDIREMVAEILGDEGYVAVLAANGAEALRYLHHAERLPRVILLDLMMPVMDGWELKSKLQSDHKLAQIPVVVITADSNAQKKMEAMGVNGFLKKPIQLNALLDLVAKYW